MTRTHPPAACQIRWWGRRRQALSSMNVDHLHLEMPEGCPPPSERLVQDYEQEFGLHLPLDYRGFLGTHGGALVNAACPFKEPTPLGCSVLVTQFYGFMPQDRQSADVRWNTRLIGGTPDVAAIACDSMGGMFWLNCAGPDLGCVYYHDAQQRESWTEDQFRRCFPRLDESIEDYLTLRRRGALPKKRPGYDSIYLVALSFSEWIRSMVMV